MPTFLLVEDDPLIAFDTQDILASRLGWRVLVAESCDSALALVKAEPIAAALLDVSLRDETSMPIADHLAAVGLPFGFATGYSEPSALPPRFQAAPIIRKPYSPDLVCRFAASLLLLPGAPVEPAA